MRRMASKTSCTISGDRPSDGSSSSSRRGRAISARPIATICCCPPDSSPAACASLASSAGNRAQHGGQRLRAAALSPPAGRLPISRFSSTVMPVNRRRPSGTMAMPASQKRCGASAVMSRPSKHDAAGARAQHAGQGVDQRGLAGAVGADDAQQLAACATRRRRPTAPVPVRRPPADRAPQAWPRSMLSRGVTAAAAAAFGSTPAVASARALAPALAPVAPCGVPR